jgi:plasmid maintenance system antidote protein VapI
MAKDDDELVDVFKTEWYRKMKATLTPGRALRAYRENRGLAREALAKLLGPTARKTHVADMEAGRRGISKEMAKKLARILGAPVERFL